MILLLAVASGMAAEQPVTPTTGRAVPELAAFDQAMVEAMRRWEVPGGTLALAKDGRLVLSRGYGLADVEKNQPVQPDALFRIASVSKPITAVTILGLVERGKLTLDAPAFAFLPQLKPLEGAKPDPRIARITVRQLLQHTAGFDRGKSFDPMFRPMEIARAAGTPPPADPESIIRYMLGRPLDFDPGTRYAYSNFGYCVLGRIIEQLTGQRYDEAVKTLVLQPAGANCIRLGRSRLSDQAPGEVRYYSSEKTAPSVFPDVKSLPGVPYGAFNLEAMDAHGGWIASAADLLRLVTKVDGSRAPALLRPETLRLLEARPAPPLPADRPQWYGLGWQITQAGTGVNWSHRGSLPGTATQLVRSHNGVAWAVLFNSQGKGGKDGLLMNDLEQRLWKAVDQVKNWPIP